MNYINKKLNIKFILKITNKLYLLEYIIYILPLKKIAFLLIL
jgi:hypothetical protein